MGVTASDKCSFCNQEKDSIVHLFWNCDIVKNFWQSFETWINVHCENAYNIRLSECYVLFGVENNFKTDRTFDLIVLLAKQYLYNCKYYNELPLLHVFKKKLLWRYKIERYNAILCQSLPSFNADWVCYKSLVSEDL